MDEVFARLSNTCQFSENEFDKFRFAVSWYDWESIAYDKGVKAFFHLYFILLVEIWLVLMVGRN